MEGHWTHRAMIRFHRVVSHRPKHWIAFSLALLLLALALPELYATYLRWRWPLPDLPQQRAGQTFHTLAFTIGPESGSGQMSVGRFQSHLQSLRRAGYHFIGLRDAHALLRHGTPLPEKSLLVTVDYRGTRQDWMSCQSAMLRSQARGVLFVPADGHHPPQGRKLRQLTHTRHWELAIAYNPFQPENDALRPSSNGEFAAPPSTAQRFERLYRLEQAAKQEHRRVRQQLPKPFPRPVMALAYPAAFCHDGGDSPTDPCVSACDIRMHLLAETGRAAYDLGFIKGDLALNSRHADPMRLNRMQVPPQWSDRELIADLQGNRDFPFRLRDANGNRAPAVWIPWLGQARREDNTLKLQASPHCVAGLWLAGSDRLSEFSADISFELINGSVRFPLLAAADESRRWELRLTDLGEIALYHMEGEDRRLIANDRWTATHHPTFLRITRRKNRLWVACNDQAMFNGWTALDASRQTGLLGIRLRGDRNGKAELRLHRVDVGPEPQRIALWEGPREAAPHGIAWMIRHAADLTTISPALGRLFLRQADGSPNQAADAEWFRVAADIYHWDVLPHVAINSPEDLARWTPEQLTDSLQTMNAQGLLVRIGDGFSWAAAGLNTWVHNVADSVQRTGHPLWLRLPEAVDRADRAVFAMLMHGLPGVRQVVASGPTPPANDAQAVEVPVPPPNPETDLRVYFDLLGTQSDRTINDKQTSIRHWRDEAESHFGAGDYEAAITLWFDWHESQPDHPRPLRRIGDALYRLGYRGEAVAFYRQSLERDPGNVALAIELATLLEAEGQQTEARDLLHLYGLLFPEQPDIMLAQAEWLMRQGRPDESLERARRILAEDPENLPASLLTAQLASDERERRIALQRLASLGNAPEHRFRVLRTILDSDLLALPEADVLLTLLSPDQEATDVDPREQALIDMLQPRDHTVESLASAEGGLPDWRVIGGEVHPDPIRIRARANAGQETVTLRLNGTERWHDMFVEAEIADQIGEFWLMARHSRKNMVRFGFDADRDQLYLQVWGESPQGHNLLNYERWPWRQSDQIAGVRLRLEIRGNGAIGYVNGEPRGRHVLSLPADLSPGWVAVAARSIEAGQAEMALHRLAAGPLFPVLAMPAPTHTEAAEERQARQLRQSARLLTAVSPAVFTVNAEGRWQSRHNATIDFQRLFARYHALRFTPRVQIENPASLRAAAIREAATIHEMDGFVFELTQTPTVTLLESLQRDLMNIPLDVFVIYPIEGREKLAVFGRAHMLLPGAPVEGRALSRVPVDRMETLREQRQSTPVILSW